MRREIQNPPMFETDPALVPESFFPAIYFSISIPAVQRGIILARHGGFRNKNLDGRIKFPI
jgi:hypothetical protein